MADNAALKSGIIATVITSTSLSIQHKNPDRPAQVLRDAYNAHIQEIVAKIGWLRLVKVELILHFLTMV